MAFFFGLVRCRDSGWERRGRREDRADFLSFSLPVAGRSGGGSKGSEAADVSKVEEEDEDVSSRSSGLPPRPERKVRRRVSSIGEEEVEEVVPGESTPKEDVVETNGESNGLDQDSSSCSSLIFFSRLCCAVEVVVFRSVSLEVFPFLPPRRFHPRSTSFSLRWVRMISVSLLLEEGVDKVGVVRREEKEEETRLLSLEKWSGKEDLLCEVGVVRFFGCVFSVFRFFSFAVPAVSHAEEVTGGEGGRHHCKGSSC